MTKNLISPSMLAFDEEKCTRCTACIEVCPSRVITMSAKTENENSLPYAKYPDFCIECGQCVAVCPHNACTHNKMPMEEFISIEQKESPVTFEQFERLIRSRRSIRTFKEKPIPKEDIVKIFDKICRHAPTGENSQSLSYSILEGDDVKKVSKKMNGLFKSAYIMLNVFFFLNLSKTLRDYRKKLKVNLQRYKEGGDPWCRHAPMIVVIYREKGWATGFEDGIISSAHFVLAAETLGIGTCYFGLAQKFSPFSSGLKKLLKVPKGKLLVYPILVGYPKYKYYRYPARKKLVLENE